MEQKFTITFSGSVDLDVTCIWPDGDAPKNPTVHDVALVMENAGHKADVLASWMLEDDLKVTVSGSSSTEVW